MGLKEIFDIFSFFHWASNRIDQLSKWISNRIKEYHENKVDKANKSRDGRTLRNIMLDVIKKRKKRGSSS